jgi:ferredoxin-NADP reductase
LTSATPTAPSRAASRLIGTLDALAAPHGIDRYLEIVRPVWSLRDPRARVMAVRRPATDSVTLTLRPNSSWAGYRAGQFIRLGVEIDGVRETRCYSPAGSDAGRDLIEITVRRHPGGKVSGYLNDHARPGMFVELSEAGGDFVLPGHLPGHLVLLSGGSGITPVMSMLRSLCARGHDGRVTFLHYSPSPDTVAYLPELDELAALSPGVRVVHGYTQASGGALSGHIDRAHLEAAGIDPSTDPAYACGPPSLLEAARDLWPSGLLHTESFLPPSLTIASDEAEGLIRFDGSDAAVPNDGRSLLEQAETAGLSPEFGCRMGICHTCTCRKTAGSVRNVLTGEISSAEDEDIQICVSVPVGDVALEL